MKVIKKYALSSFITFLSVFCVAIVSQIDNLNADALQQGALVSLMFAAVRAAVKGVVEYLAGKVTVELVK